MKTKRFEKKLRFNKETIADLDKGQLGDVKGGDTGTCISFCVCHNTRPTFGGCPTCRIDIDTNCF